MKALPRLSAILDSYWVCQFRYAGPIKFCGYNKAVILLFDDL